MRSCETRELNRARTYRTGGPLYEHSLTADLTRDMHRAVSGDPRNAKASTNLEGHIRRQVGQVICWHDREFGGGPERPVRLCSKTPNAFSDQLF